MRALDVKDLYYAYRWYSFYDLVTDHYQSGWAARFHFCGFAPHESWECAQARHEHHLALMTGIKPGMKVLDVGCGIGCPMREIAIFTGAHVTGININRMHLERAKRYSRGWWKLTDEVEFVHGDFMVGKYPVVLLAPFGNRVFVN